MTRVIPFLAVLGLFLALAFCERTYLQTSESLPLPPNWARLSNVEGGDRLIKLIFAVKQRNLHILDEAFWAISTPGDLRYGDHLTIDQINDMIAPTELTLEKIIFWLKSQGIRDARVLRSHDYITCSMTMAQAERIFEVKFSTYRHSSGVIFKGTLGPYSLPDAIAEELDLVSGLVGIPNLELMKRPILGNSQAADQLITPEIIRARYNVTENLVVTNSNNSNAVAEFQSQFYSPSDLATFFKDYVPFAPAQVVDKVIGTNIPQLPGIEASLDIQYLMGVAPNASTSFYSYASFNFFNDLLNWTSALASSPSIPWVHSVSYGTQGDYPDSATIQRLDTEFQKIGARGASVIIASGDDGSGCKTSLKDCKCTLYPSYPGSSPYVTSIGATRFLNANSGPEGAVTAFGSGGGFFEVDTQPSYQAADVTQYFNGQTPSQLPPSCSYNPNVRGTPDASALGDVYYQVVVNGAVTSVGGTSASTPTFSAIFTLLNDIRLNAGKPTLGFLNPFLYESAAGTPNAFFDVTVGNNVVGKCCTDNGGFQCSPGWDPVTGVGTPNFAVLSTLVV
jgi:tripeptidyl-peptidase-1